MLDPLWLLDKEPPALKVPQEANQAVALISVRVPRTAQIFVQGELFYPRMMLAHAIHDAAAFDDIREDGVFEHHPARGVLFCRLAPGYVGA